MKRFIRVLLVALCLLPLSVFASAETQAQPCYTATVCKDCHLLDAPGGSQMAEMPRDCAVSVLEWGAEWCLVRYRNDVGYAKTAWLYELRSLDPVAWPLPENACVVDGMVVLKEDLFLQGGTFRGTNLQSGAILGARIAPEGGYSVPVWRGETLLSEDIVFWLPFADPETALPGDILAGYTTFYGSQLAPDMAMEREHNIRVGCERIDGCVLAPGESFSFNALCGPYRQKNGYQYAPNISEKGYGYGGGVCQVSTTLYNALLETPLPVTAWRVHRYIGVAYIPQFYDSAVGSHTDLCFVNTLPYAILVRAQAADGLVLVMIERAE